jgi:succinate dehydrogenase/fumarate reductase flavoprotein subunit
MESPCLDHEQRLARLEQYSSRDTISDIQDSIQKQGKEIASITTTISSLKETPNQIAEIRERLARIEGLIWIAPTLVGVGVSIISLLLKGG